MAAAKPLLLACFSMLLLACDSRTSNTALGTIERDRVVLKATATELITQLPQAEGQQVHAGDLLVQLDPRRQQARVAHAQAQLLEAEARWAELRSGARIEDIDAGKARVAAAEAAHNIADKTYQRALKLRRQRLNTEAELDQARAQLDTAKANLQTAQKQLLVMTNGTRQEELDQAQAAFHAAQATLELEQYALTELSVVATRDGYLDSLPWNLGERVEANSVVAILLADQQAFARVYVPEPWRARLQLGDQLDIKVDGIDTKLAGRLRWIAREPAFTPYYALNERDRARLVYLAEVDVLDKGIDLPIGVPVEVRLKNTRPEDDPR